MNATSLPKIASVTDLRYRTAEIIRNLKTGSAPYAITKDSQYVAVIVSPDYYENSMRAYEMFMDYIDTIDLEKEIESAKEDGMDFEKYVENRLGRNYVQDHIKKKSSKISR